MTETETIRSCLRVGRANLNLRKAGLLGFEEGSGNDPSPGGSSSEGFGRSSYSSLLSLNMMSRNEEEVIEN